MVRAGIRRLLAASLLLSCPGCKYDSACEVVLKHAPGLRQRLTMPEEAQHRKGAMTGLTHLLTPAMAERLLKETEAVELELPVSARAEDLNMLLEKLASRRSALEQALRDFLAIDPRRLDKGLESGAVIPVRRGVETSRNAMLSLADTVTELCRMRQ